MDLSSVFTASARERAAEFGVTDRVTFVQADASGYVADTPVDIVACIGATWIGGGLDGTIELLERSLRPGGLLLVGEPFWRKDPPDQETVEACHATTKDDFRDLPGLVAHFGELGWDLVQMVLADQDSWDRYVAAQWFNIREWLDANPGDEMAAQMREELAHRAGEVRPLRAGVPGLGSLRPEEALTHGGSALPPADGGKDG